MAEALEAAVHLGGDLAVPVVEAVEGVLPGVAAFRDMQILIGHELRDGEAVVELHHADLFARVLNPRLLVGLCAALACRVEMLPVPLVEAPLVAAGDGELDRLDGDDILFSEGFGDLRRRHDRAGRAVADPAAVEEPQRVGDDRGGEDLLQRHRLPEMRLGVENAVRVALHRDVGDRPFEVLVGDPELCGVGRGELGEEARCGAVGKPLPDERTESGTGVRQAAVAGILQFFHADGEADIVGPGGHPVDGPPEGLRPRGAVIFRPGDGDVRKPQGHPERRRRFAQADLLDAVAEPRRLDLILLNPRVGEALLEGLHQQLLGPHVPAFPEAAAPHPENCHLVPDSRSHCSSLLRNLRTDLKSVPR